MVGDEDESQNERRRRSKGDNKRKRLRKAREEDVMEAADDEDLELIREAQGVRCVAREGWRRSAVVMSRGFIAVGVRRFRCAVRVFSAGVLGRCPP